MGDFKGGKIRNICILAHVDHGKTTLADHLIASYGGGVLHPKQAGRLRFMDYLDEEQRRAITMKSSCISLEYKEHTINLIDSPGHVDFCSEVSAAARLSDGALVLVDAVEGVHIQTHAVLHQAWIEKLSPCLVLNKIDRLITELKLSPLEAYARLQRIVHEVNGIVSAFKSNKYLSDVDALASELNEDDDEQDDTFQPHKGNVAFVCALDGWGFTILDFAEFYASKHGFSSTALQRALWDPCWYYNAKAKKIVHKKKKNGISNARPMFVQWILEPLWQVYQGDRGILEKVINNFNLSIPLGELGNKDPKAVVKSVMSRWIPLSDTILSIVVKHVPDPIIAQSFRISRFLPERRISVLEEQGKKTRVLAEEVGLVRKAVESCDCSCDAPCIAFVSKMFAVPSKMLPRGEMIEDSSEEEEEECFLAFARVFSGVVHSNQKVFVLTSKYNPLEEGGKHVQEVELQSLYLMMGQGLKPVASAKAGNIVAIRGLGLNILKSATLSSTKRCWPFSDMNYQVAPILKVAIEPSDPADIVVFEKGLDLLNHADPLVEVESNDKGEYILCAAGEVHLERCIQDLKDRFAKQVSFQVSPPLVSYKETIIDEAAGDLNYLTSSSLVKFLSGGTSSDEFVEKTTPNGRCVVRVRVMKLPTALTNLLHDNSDRLGDIIRGSSGLQKRGSTIEVEVIRKLMIDAVETDYSDEKCRILWEQQLLKRIWALGPNQVGPNLLLTPTPTPGLMMMMSKKNGGDESESVVLNLIKGHPSVSEKLGFMDSSLFDDELKKKDQPQPPPVCRRRQLVEDSRLENSVVSGFQVATAAGPLCEEPMWGLAFVVEAYVSSEEEEESRSESSEDFCFSGQVMAAVKDGCREALRERKPRLVEPMFSCKLNTPAEHLRSVNAVLNRRRAQFLDDKMQQGYSLFTVHAYLPVTESFGFTEELRRRTSGAASAQLVLSRWEALEEDPYFVPKTLEEKEEFGDGSSVAQNKARKLVDAVRRRKGLPVEEKLVRHATKQRTLGRKV